MTTPIILFLPVYFSRLFSLIQDNWFQRGNQSARFLDDTCTTQLFCQSLISSTPIRKSLKLAHSRFNQENLYM